MNSRAGPGRPLPATRRRAGALAELTEEVVRCRLCPRLVAWRERVATEKRSAFADWEYWGRPVPGFGDPAARIMIVGLAPAAHGGNRTGRIFTGDRSGDFLVGLANQPVSTHRGDGLRLRGVYVSAVNRCCPPGNHPTPRERDNCLPYLVGELQSLDLARVVVPLGSFAWEGVLRALGALGHGSPRPRPRFGHGVEEWVGPYTLLGSFHPSQQNTFTGKLTEEMLDAVLARAKNLAR